MTLSKATYSHSKVAEAYKLLLEFDWSTPRTKLQHNNKSIKLEELYRTVYALVPDYTLEPGEGSHIHAYRLRACNSTFTCKEMVKYYNLARGHIKYEICELFAWSRVEDPCVNWEE